MASIFYQYNAEVLEFPQLSPIMFSIGAIDFYWYGMMYVIGFVSFWVLSLRRAANPASGIRPEQVGDMLFYGIIGVIVGGRMGYILFYQFERFMADWTVLLRIWEGGMSFHGGVLGVLLALWLFARKQKQSFLKTIDFCIPPIPIGLCAGRIGNFINGELWGRPSDLPWAMVFPHVDALPRHPSQLYEAVLEGLFLFVVLWIYASKPHPYGRVAGWFAILYSGVRFLVEFTRAPDPHLQFIAWDWLTMGQLLSVPLCAAGILLLYLSRRQVIRS